METLHEAILLRVQYNIKQELIKQLDERLYYTGHGVVVKDLDDVKNATLNYAANEIDTATRRLYLMMGR